EDRPRGRQDITKRLPDDRTQRGVHGLKRVGVLTIGKKRNNQRPSHEADHLHHGSSDPDANRPASKLVGSEATDQQCDRGEQSRRQSKNNEERDDRSLILTKLSQDLRRWLLENVGVVEDRSQAQKRDVCKHHGDDHEDCGWAARAGGHPSELRPLTDSEASGALDIRSAVSYFARAELALSAQFHQSAFDAIPRVGIVDLLGDGGRTRPEVRRLRVRTKRRRTIRSLLQALEGSLEVPTACEVKGEQFELVVQRVGEGLLVGGGHEAVKLASARSGQR